MGPREAWATLGVGRRLRHCGVSGVLCWRHSCPPFKTLGFLGKIEDSIKTLRLCRKSQWLSTG